MNNKLLEFSEKLAIKRASDEEKKELIKNKDSFIFNSYTEKITFYLGYRSHITGMSYLDHPYTTLIQLDDEDLDYFKNKYLPKIEDEYQANLAELNSKYGKAL